MKSCILVTGGSRGIGRAIAVALAKKEPVVINYLSNEAAALEAKALVEANGAEAILYSCDVADVSQVSEMYKTLKQHYGLWVRVLINNAGITRDQVAAMLSVKNWDQVIQSNLSSAFYCVKKAIPAMVSRKEGVIVNVSSVSGIHGNIGQANYSASKAGLIALTQTLTRELSPFGVRVNCVAPGFIDTDMTKVMFENQKIAEALNMAKDMLIPVRRFGNSEEVAKAVRFLVSEDASYIAGHTLVVDGGLSA